MFHTGTTLVAGVIWALASGMYTESMDERMANLENTMSQFSRIVKENDNTLHDLLTAVS